MISIEDAMRQQCLCCGPDSVQQRCLSKYLTQNSAKECAPNHIWVYCNNEHCNSHPQKFTCLMEWLEIIDVSTSIPKMLYDSDVFLKHAIHHYIGYTNGNTPTSDIYLPFCIGCSLSAVIKDGTTVSLTNVPRPLPLPQRMSIYDTTILNNETSDNNINEPEEFFQDANGSVDDGNDVLMPMKKKE